MIDPYALKVKEKKLRDKDLIDEVKFGDIIHITISVEADDGLQLDMSNIGSQENYQMQQEPLAPIKIGDLNLSELDEMIANDEQAFDKPNDGLDDTCLTSRSERATREDREQLMRDELQQQQQNDDLVKKLFEDAKIDVSKEEEENKELL